MTSDEINKAINKYQIFSLVYLIPGMLLLFLAANHDLLVKFCFSCSNLVSKPTFIVSALALGVASIFFSIYLANRQYLPKCPSCQFAFSPDQAAIVIATKNCTSCGKNVIS